MNTRGKLVVLFICFMLNLSISVAKAEDMELEKANEEIARLTIENDSLKTQIKYFEDEIAAHREKLDAYDNPEDSDEESE